MRYLTFEKIGDGSFEYKWTPSTMFDGLQVLAELKKRNEEREITNIELSFDAQNHRIVMNRLSPKEQIQAHNATQPLNQEAQTSEAPLNLPPSQTPSQTERSMLHVNKDPQTEDQAQNELDSDLKAFVPQYSEEDQNRLFSFLFFGLSTPANAQDEGKVVPDIHIDNGEKQKTPTDESSEDLFEDLITLPPELLSQLQQEFESEDHSSDSKKRAHSEDNSTSQKKSRR